MQLPWLLKASMALRFPPPSVTPLPPPPRPAARCALPSFLGSPPIAGAAAYLKVIDRYKHRPSRVRVTVGVALADLAAASR